MPPSASNQTAKYLRSRFAAVGLRPTTRHGQHFLIDQNLLRLIVERAELSRSDVVLEVGTGTGGLAAMIAERAAALVTVELDEPLYQLALEELRQLENVVSLHADALANKSNLNPLVVEAVERQLAAHSEANFKLVANLPYNVATPVVANLLMSPIVPVAMTITVQKEVADRIVARPNTKDYGALPVWLQSQCRVELVRTLPPSVFWPRPKVNSAIVHLELDPERRAAIGNLAEFHRFVRQLFQHRRKFLRGALASTAGKRADKQAVDAALAACGIGPQSRAEQLDVASILRLCEAMRHACAEHPAG